MRTITIEVPGDPFGSLTVDLTGIEAIAQITADARKHGFKGSGLPLTAFIAHKLDQARLTEKAETAMREAREEAERHRRVTEAAEAELAETRERMGYIMDAMDVDVRTRFTRLMEALGARDHTIALQKHEIKTLKGRAETVAVSNGVVREANALRDQVATLGRELSEKRSENHRLKEDLAEMDARLNRQADTIRRLMLQKDEMSNKLAAVSKAMDIKLTTT